MTPSPVTNTSLVALHIPVPNQPHMITTLANLALQPTQPADPLTAVLTLDQLLNNLSNENVLENSAQTALAVQMIINALSTTALKPNCSAEASRRCVNSFRGLIPIMSPEQIRSALSLVMSLLADEEIGVQNTKNTLISLVATNVDVLIPILVEEIKDIAQPDGDIIRDEIALKCGEGLLEALTEIIALSQLTNETYTLIAQGLMYTWKEEKKRHLPLSPPILDNTILTLARRYARDDFADFLIRVVLETKDQNPTTYTIFPICQAASEVFLQNPERINPLIDFLSENPSYHIIWILGNLAQSPQALPIDASKLLNILLSILEKSNTWQEALQAAQTLGKMSSILEQNQKHQAIAALQQTLLGMHHINQVVKVQIGAAWALGEIGITTPEYRDIILAILMSRCMDRNDDVRLAIARALKSLGQVDSPIQGPLIFTVLLGFLSDQDAQVRKVAAKALSESIQRYAPYAITQLQAILEAAKRALNIPPLTNSQKWENGRIAVIWMLYAIARIVPAFQRQRPRTLIQAHANDPSRAVREAVQKVLPKI